MRRYGVFISTLTEFYAAIAPLRDVKGHDKFTPSLAVQLIQVIAQCERFLSSEESRLFPSASQETQELIRLAQALQVAARANPPRIVYDDFLSKLKDSLSTEGVKPSVAESISRASQKLLLLMQDTINSMPLFLVETRGIFDVKKLIEAPDEALPRELSDWVRANSKVAIADLEAGCNCLAFGLATSVGFHLMRFVEALLFPYYEKLPAVTGAPAKLREKDSDRNWARYIEKLEKRGAKSTVVKLLHHLKDDYRNPLMHPDDTLDLEEADLLLGTVRGIAYALYADLKDRNLI